MDIRLFTKASTGKDMATRRGLGKVRHISINKLWIQAKIAEKTIVIIKIKNKLNPADLMTKYLSKDEIRQIMDGLMHQHSEGRNADAPELSIVEDTWHESRQTPFPTTSCSQHIQSEQLMMSTSPKNEDEETQTCMTACMNDGKRRQVSESSVNQGRQQKFPSP